MSPFGNIGATVLWGVRPCENPVTNAAGFQSQHATTNQNAANTSQSSAAIMMRPSWGDRQGEGSP